MYVKIKYDTVIYLFSLKKIPWVTFFSHINLIKIKNFVKRRKNYERYKKINYIGTFLMKSINLAILTIHHNCYNLIVLIFFIFALI